MDKDLQQRIEERERVITSLLSRLEKRVSQEQAEVLNAVLQNFVDKLETDENGKILSSAYNRSLMQNFDTVFNKIAETTGVKTATEIASGASQILAVNKAYYQPFAEGKTQLNKIGEKAQNTMRGWIGLDKDGKVKANGYLDTVIKSKPLRNVIKDMSMRAIVGQQGWNETKTEIKEFLVGNQLKSGAFEKYYRNYVYDTYSHLDRAVAEQYANDLKLNFAIYEGGLMETSRKFCREHNGKVYHKEEIAQMKPEKAIPPNYNPFFDMGGYACRHHWNWIPDSVAFALRPDAKEKWGTKKAQEESSKKAEAIQETKPLSEQIEILERDYGLDYNISPELNKPSESHLRKEMSNFNFLKVFDTIAKNFPEAKEGQRKDVKLTTDKYVTKLSYRVGENLILRKFYKEDGRNVVEHSYFEIEKKLQGSGISKTIFRDLVQEYEKAGVDEIRVYANIDVGGYTWAKYGFKSNSSTTVGMIIKKGYTNNLFSDAEYDNLKEWYGKEKAKGNIDMRYLANKSYGKELLLGSNWEGIIDLKDPVQLRTFKDYLGLE